MRAISHQHAGAYSGTPADTITLRHDERHLRRKLLSLPGGGQVLVDLPHAVALRQDDALVLEDGRLIRIAAAPEELYEVRARDDTHLARLCWHIGNRHLPAQMDGQRVLIQRDHVIRDMLTGLGATVAEIVAPFTPETGAYHGQGGHDHGHHHHG